MTSLEHLRAGQLAGTRRLTLACGLQTFPHEIFELADTLEILDLSHNALSELPADLPRLHRLRVLFCSNNQFTELPAVLGQCAQLTMIGFKANQIRSVPGAALAPALRWLILTDNQIEELPPEIGRCSQLQKLMLAGNRLRTLPPELATCARLELLRIAANQLTEFPADLLALPRLSWLAYAGNPFCAAQEAAAFSDAASAPIAWDGLQLQQVLGEGASGVIHQALWQGGADVQAVAVKLFKGAVTSDGLPQCEMSACLQAGAHPHLIPALGPLDGHPGGTPGLVMALIDPGFRTLAGPPSLDSCTRDSYAAETRFDLPGVINIALAIACAARHLHAQGLMHGDLYAHNILHNAQGEALLGDFGAASFLALDDHALAHALQGLEVRAFACLLEELLARCTPPAEAALAWETLVNLKTACFHETPSERPLFADIERCLRSISLGMYDPSYNLLNKFAEAP